MSHSNGLGSRADRLSIAALMIASSLPFVVGLGAMTTAFSVGVARVLLLLAVVLGVFGIVTLVRQR